MELFTYNSLKNSLNQQVLASWRKQDDVHKSLSLHKKNRFPTVTARSEQNVINKPITIR